ncbi:hypothetical protein GCM10023165_34100 [Variovorax defluvii]|uniref:Uncharacterized protein n=1 Tax=Variovorax defluvii TaxID=913761 RepID=A0ABP8HZW8_9BURK
MSLRRVGGSALKFDSGIDLIVRGTPAPSLPFGEVAPASVPQRSLLDQLYALPTLDDYLWGEIGAEVAEAGLLLPHRFWQGVRDARERLLAAAAADGRNARLLHRAVDVLDDQSELFALLQHYRLSLVAG